MIKKEIFRTNQNMYKLQTILIKLLGFSSLVEAPKTSQTPLRLEIYHHNNTTLIVKYAYKLNRVIASGSEEKIAKLEEEGGLIEKIKKELS